MESCVLRLAGRLGGKHLPKSPWVPHSCHKPVRGYPAAFPFSCHQDARHSQRPLWTTMRKWWGSSETEGQALRCDYCEQYVIVRRYCQRRGQRLSSGRTIGPRSRGLGGGQTPPLSWDGNVWQTWPVQPSSGKGSSVWCPASKWTQQLVGLGALPAPRPGGAQSPGRSPPSPSPSPPPPISAAGRVRHVDQLQCVYGK